jgi:hypothetical protein
MQKLSTKSIVMLYKSCRVVQMESNEIGFAVFGFLYNFLQILQDQPTTIHYLRNQLLSRPLERLKLKYFCPWEARRRGRPELAGAGAEYYPASRSGGAVARQPLELHSG